METKDKELKIKSIRKMLINIFLFQLFIPHLCVTLLLVAITNHILLTLTWQLWWFLTYFLFTIVMYIFTPKLIKKT